MATITELKEKIAKYEADIQKRMERIAKLEQRELKFRKQLEDAGIVIPEFDKYVRSRYAKKPNSMGHYYYDDFFDMKDTVSADDWEVIYQAIYNNSKLWQLFFDYEHTIHEQLSSWNKIFEIEDKITSVQTKLQQEQVKQAEIEDIPPILKDLKDNVYQSFVNKYIEWRDTAKYIAQQLGSMRPGPYRKEMQKELVAIYGGIALDYERWANMTGEKLREEAKKSAEAYVLDLIRRVTRKVGNIVDYSDLTVNGPALNGRIVGDRGSTYVETIVAGGYNIQRAHLRVILH